MDTREQKLAQLTGRRWRVATALTALMMIIYFGFMLLVAYRKEWVGTEIVPGLSWGILLGAGVILAAWLLTFVYVKWANLYYDVKVEAIRKQGRDEA